MGNENSVLDKCDIAEKYVEVANWRIYRGTYLQESGSNDTIPIAFFERQLGENSCKLEAELSSNATKCLKIYRHPSIVKFHFSGLKNSNVFMITEHVEPLSGILYKLSSLEICSGLDSIMTALSFCHETCSLRHNNLCLESIFVTLDGTWKLAGMEFACLFRDYTQEFRQRNRSFRHESIIPPEEKDESTVIKNDCGHAGDVYGLGLLIETLLENIVKSDSLFGAKEFMDLIKKDVLISDPEKRPKVSKLLEHVFFKNEFLDVCKFLQQITLKADSDKQVFFCNLTADLLRLPEELVASRLVELLLSRFVLMDHFAEKYFLPNFFRPSRGDEIKETETDEQITPIISSVLYKEHVIPHIIRIFEVHDRIIRRVLLTYFECYVALFDPTTLKEKILPEVLLSVKDTNNELVVLSLRALACLVPLLGSDVVIGGQRLQYFKESKPKDVGLGITATQLVLPETNSTKITEEALPKRFVADVESHSNPDRNNSVEPKLEEDIPIPAIERSSPDGSESSGCLDNHSAGDEWLDWDNSPVVDNTPENEDNPIENDSTIGKEIKNKSLGEEFNIMALEIKNSSNELDFFADMQPKIVPTAVMLKVSNSGGLVNEDKPKISFAVAHDEEVLVPYLRGKIEK